MSLHLLLRVIFMNTHSQYQTKTENKKRNNNSLSFLQKKKKKSISEHTTNKGHLTKRSVSMESVRTGKTSVEMNQNELQEQARATLNVFQSNRTDGWHSILRVPPAGNYLPDRTLLWNLISWRSRLMA